MSLQYDKIFSREFSETTDSLFPFVGPSDYAIDTYGLTVGTL